MGSYGDIWSHYGVIWGRYGDIWGLYRVIWGHMELLWDCGFTGSLNRVMGLWGYGLTG